MSRTFPLCLSLLMMSLPAAAVAQGKPPNIHFMIDTSGSMRELPQVINSQHDDFFYDTVNGCTNPQLDAVIASRQWSTASGPQPLPDPGTGLGSDTGFPNLFQDNKFYGYMDWYDSSSPPPRWDTKEAACQGQVPNWNTTNSAEYSKCLSCLSTKGYFKQADAEGVNVGDVSNPDFIFWGRFLNFNPPRYVTVRAAIKKALQEVQGARVGYSYFSNTASGSTLGQQQRAVCDLALDDLTAFDTYRASYINGVNGLSYTTSSSLARALLNVGYYFTSGNDIYQSVFGFGSGYSYPTDFRNPVLTSEQRSWCWGDQTTSVVLISEGEPANDSLNSTIVSQLRALNGGPVYCPDGAPCGSGGLFGRDKGPNPSLTALADDNANYMLDDVAKLLATQDLQRNEPPVVGNFDTSGRQSLRIHTISFGVTNNLLRNTAAVGNGLYFTAPDADTLQTAVRSILCQSGARTSACPATP